jgi:hypothetical protein
MSPCVPVEEPPAAGFWATPDTDGLPSFAAPDVVPLGPGAFEPLVPFEEVAPFEDVLPFGDEVAELDPEFCPDPGAPPNIGTPPVLLSELEEQPAATSASKIPKFAVRRLSCLRLMIAMLPGAGACARLPSRTVKARGTSQQRDFIAKSSKTA